MLTNIKPFHNSAFHCLEDCVVSIVRSNQCDYELMFQHTWDFLYQENINIPLGERIIVSFDTTMNDLEKHHGIKLVLHKNTPDQIIQFIDDEINRNQKPVIIFSREDDTSYIIIGIDTTNNLLHYYYPPHSISEIPYQKTTAIIHDECFTVEFNEQNHELPDWKQLLQEVVARVESNHIFENIRKFSRDFSKDFSVENDLEEWRTDIFKAPIFWSILRTGYGRRQFGVFLEFLHKKYNLNALSGFILEFNKIGNEWDIIRSMMTKMVLVSNTDDIIQRVSKKLASISDKEEQLLGELVKFLTEGPNYNQSDDLKMAINHKENLSKKEIIYVDISEFANNIGFGDTSNQCKANFDDMGFCFNIQGIPEHHLDVGNIRFNFPKADGQSFDNICCNEQKILCKSGRYNSIMMLGAAEFGNFSSVIKLEYIDGTFEEIPIEFSDWWAPVPNYGETVAWETKAICRKDSKIELLPNNVRLYTEEYRIKSTVDLYAIHLPICMNIHVFAISLGL